MKQEHNRVFGFGMVHCRANFARMRALTLLYIFYPGGHTADVL